MRVASFFSGIGGFDIGLEKAGMKVVFQCEIDKYCCKVLNRHWPEIKRAGDINEIETKDIPKSELWCGGFPCQDVSLANQGKRAGLNGSRSGLFFKFAELIAEGKPEWVFIENVPGLLNSNNGEDFKVVIQTLDELGYCVSWRILDAKYFGTPQRRRRIYIVASYRNMRAAEVLFEQGATTITYRSGLGEKEISAQRHGKSNNQTTLYAIQHAGIGRRPSAGPQAKGYRNDGETYTLDSRGGADALCKTDAPFGVRETTGVPSGMDGSRYRSIGNAVPVPVIEWIGKRIMNIASKNN